MTGLSGLSVDELAEKVRGSEGDYIDRTIETVRNHRDADNCWPQWANIFADEIERLRGVATELASERDQAVRERDEAEERCNERIAAELGWDGATTRADRLAAALMVAGEALEIAGDYVVSIADEVTTKRPDVQAALEDAIAKVESIARDALAADQEQT